MTYRKKVNYYILPNIFGKQMVANNATSGSQRHERFQPGMKLSNYEIKTINTTPEFVKQTLKGHHMLM